MPERTTVAAPVSEVRATSFVGRLSVPVKWPVSHRMIAASTMPTMTASTAIMRGSPSKAISSLPVSSSAKVAGR